MKTIWKYEIEIKDYQCIQMPVGAKILCIQTQFKKTCIWALVDRNEYNTEKREFEIYGAGHPYKDGYKNYIGTFQIGGGSHVFHVFEVLPE